MASTELIVAFSAQVEGLTTSLKRVNSTLEEMQHNASQAGNAIQRDVGGLAGAFSSLTNSIKSAVLAYAGFQGVQALARVAVTVDDLNTSLRRLQLLTGSSASSIQTLFANLNQVGAQTGSSVQSLTDQFQRFYVATSALGASQAQVQQLVTTLARFGQISSGGPQEAAAAITQLSQGLASGKLQGDELKSILENMPMLAQALAQALGVGVGELRKMGEEGKLTADRVFPALIQAGDTLARQLQGMPLSLRQSFQVAMDGMTRAVQEADKAIGATEFMSRVLQWIGRGGQAVSVRIGGGAPGAEAQQQAEQEIDRLRENLHLQEQIRDAEMARRAAMPAAQANLPINAERYRVVTENLRQAQEQFASASQDAVTRAIQNAGAQVQGQYEDTSRFYNGITERARQTDQTLTAIENRADQRRRISHKAEEDRTAARALLSATSTEAERQRVANAIRLIDTEERRDLEAIANREGADARASAARTLRENQADQRERDRRASAARDRFLRDSDTPLLGFRRDINQSLEGMGALFSLNGGGTTENISRVVEFLGNATADLQQNLRRIGETGTDVGKVLEEVFNERVRGALEVAGLTAQQIDQILARSMERARTEMDRTAAKSDEVLKMMQSGAQTIAAETSGALVDFAIEGTAKFDEMALNIAKSIAKMILQFLILQAVIQGIKAVGGPDLSLVAGRRQAGGPVSAGQPYIVGEKRPELFVPTGSGHILPMVPGGGGTTINVYNQAPGTTTRQQERTNGMGGKEVDIYIEQVMQRAVTSGRMDNAFGSAFGAQRVGRV